MMTAVPLALSAGAGYTSSFGDTTWRTNSAPSGPLLGGFPQAAGLGVGDDAGVERQDLLLGQGGRGGGEQGGEEGGISWR